MIREELLALADELEGMDCREGCSTCPADGTKDCRGDLSCEEAVARAAARRIREVVEHDACEVTTVSAYDLLPDEDRKAIAWVRDHGGLGAVRRRWEFLRYYDDPVPRSYMEKRLARLKRQIDENHAALRRKNQRIAVLASEINREHNENRMEFLRRAGNFTAFADEVCERLAPQLRHVEGCTKDVMDAALEALDRRLMPEGCEWDGSVLRIRTAENVDYDGETLFVLIGGRDE